MGFDADRVSTLSFDSYSTIVDVEAAIGALSEYTDNAESVSNLWRTRSLMYAMHSTLVGTYQPFYEMVRDSLDYVFAVTGDLAGESLTREDDIDIRESSATGAVRPGEDCYTFTDSFIRFDLDGRATVLER